MAPSLTETVFDLGGQDWLVGRTARCNRPAAALKIPQVGAYLHPDLERIISLKPDLVLATKLGLREEIVERLTELGIPVFVDDSKSVDDVCHLMERLGRLFHREKEAASAIEDIQRRRRGLQARLKGLPRPSVLFAVGVKPLVVAGGQSFLGSLIREAGGVNIAEDIAIPYARFSFEEVIKKDPEYILVLDKECKEQECVDHFKRYPMLRAVRDGKVASVDADLVARAAPAVIEAVELIAKTLHPHAQEMRALNK
ncbi:MAG: ABC transporter substrate-binding protein [Desulfomonilaceae bacterium]